MQVPWVLEGVVSRPCASASRLQHPSSLPKPGCYRGNHSRQALQHFQIWVHNKYNCNCVGPRGWSLGLLLSILVSTPMWLITALGSRNVVNLQHRSFITDLAQEWGLTEIKPQTTCYCQDVSSYKTDNCSRVNVSNRVSYQGVINPENILQEIVSHNMTSVISLEDSRIIHLILFIYAIGVFQVEQNNFVAFPIFHGKNKTQT